MCVTVVSEKETRDTRENKKNTENTTVEIFPNLMKHISLTSSNPKNSINSKYYKQKKTTSCAK